MPNWLSLVLNGVAAALLGYLINQLPPLRHFPSKNALIFRLTIELVALGIILTAIGDKDNSQHLVWLRIGGIIVGTLLVSEVVRLVRAMRQNRQQTQATP